MGIDQQGRGRAEAFKRVEDEKEQRQASGIVSALPQTKFWELLVMTSRAEALIKGNEFRDGIKIAVEAAEQIQATGVMRYLDRIYGIQQYLDRLTREIGQLSAPLREILDGGQYKEI
jgi:hypothetical protein